MYKKAIVKDLESAHTDLIAACHEHERLLRIRAQVEQTAFATNDFEPLYVAQRELANAFASVVMAEADYRIATDRARSR